MVAESHRKVLLPPRKWRVGNQRKFSKTKRWREVKCLGGCKGCRAARAHSRPKRPAQIFTFSHLDERRRRRGTTMKMKMWMKS